MKQCLRISAILMLVTYTVIGDLSAQPKAVSSIWSFSGIGVGYEYRIDDRSFGQIDLRTEMSEVFRGIGGVTGVAASFTWNMIFADIESGNGNMINLFSGPGAVIGWAQDYGDSPGGIFGLKGRIGAECVFERRIAVSICLSPILGMHVSRKNDVVSMRLYRNGLMSGLFPEVGIKYAF